ncbi:hypothetical protein PIROE2DRAFT_58171 [Piromyces sp. E2]|nr:hypothetical protein PIROE2DRAFT_58171 [Piromyces sp. E2]|eukprot:OUM68293.1 hypothetical protein PIROE2DRAFT_58171 [Piromyces sp. E2]
MVLSDSGYLSLLEYEVINNENDSYIQDPLNEDKKINLCIINQSLVLNENGTIIDLAYLYPFQDDLNKIILVALICSEEKIYIVSYTFDNSDNLKCKNNFKSVPFLDATQSMPIQLVPLPQFPECFIVLTINKRTNELSVHDKIIDLSLLTDCAFLDSESFNNNVNTKKLFVTCGYQPNGSIKSIENGIKVSLLSSQLSLEGTICAGSILNEEYLIQVTENKIISIYCNDNSEKLEKYEIVNEFVPSDSKKILKAEIVDNYILLNYSDSKTIEIIKVNNENPFLTFESIQEIQLNDEISTMKLIIKK